MNPKPELVDRAALCRYRQRAASTTHHGKAGFLHDHMVADVQERLIEVNRTFTNPAIVTGFPEFWHRALPGATIVADTDLLALERAAHDVVVHAMGLHWSNDPLGQLVQCRLALKPDGFFMAQFLGGRTLHQLRAALAHAETAETGGVSPRVVPMAEIRELGDLLLRAGFAMPVADTSLLTALYPSPIDLMHELRAMGESNALSGRLRHPTRRTVFKKADAVYRESFANEDGTIPATFEIISLTGWCPDESQPKPLRPGSAKQRLADALKVEERRLSDEG
jgi:hypothetical protein